MRYPRTERAADAAKSLLTQASRRLLTPDPNELPHMGGVLDESLDWDLRGGPPAHSTGPFEPTFAESRGNALAFQVSPGDRYVTPNDQVEMTTQAMQAVVDAGMGPAASRWFHERSEPFRARQLSLSTGFGANFSTAVDRNGVVEAAATYGWHPELTSHFHDTIVEMARRATAALDCLYPFATTIRAGRRAGGQQISFDITREIDFAELKPLMEAFGMGNRHGGLTTVGAFVLGARYRLPAHSSVLTLLRSGEEIELRLDINLDALADAPAILLPLLRLPMAERPSGLQAFDRWLTALTPDGYTGPGNVTVLSIRVRPSMPARLAVFLRPVAFDPGEAEPVNGVVDEYSADELPQWGAA